MSLLVWQYWEGPMPPYVELCIETVRRHHPDARLLDRGSFDELWTTDRDVPLDQLGPQHRSDFVRAWLLHHHGGVWVDADFVLLRPFDELFALPDPLTFSGYREAEEQFANNLMFSREGDPVLAAYYARVAAHLRAGEEIKWLEIGAYPLTAAVEAHRDSVSVIDPELVYPSRGTRRSGTRRRGRPSSSSSRRATGRCSRTTRSARTCGRGRATTC